MFADMSQDKWAGTHGRVPARLGVCGGDPRAEIVQNVVL
jgi:hypothetical protein